MMGAAIYLPVAAPLAAALAALFLRRTPAAAFWLALAGAALALAGSALLLTSAAEGASREATLPGLPGYPLRLVADSQTALFSTLVAAVSALVLVYAVGYMRGEEGLPRFFAGMGLFAAAMQALVLAGDWVLLLAAWEIIGFASWILIGFWFSREDARAGATRAFLYTRTADLGLYAGVFVLISASNTSEIAETLSVSGPAATAAGLLLLLAAVGKSAQAPLSGWLQDAMSGPTPVSALLHSATLVAAGAILLIRVYPLLPAGVLLAVGLLGGVTTVLAGLTALAERDLKRLLAASTSGQYGFMLLAVGAGSPVAAAFHLVAHAAIKSSLFLAAGVFQHERGSTDFAHLGGAGRARKAAYVAFAVAGLALAGVPPLSGFFSKDAILAAAFDSRYAAALAPLALIGTLLTGLYVGRALRLLRGAPHQAAVSVDQTRPRGSGWMYAGLFGLALAAALLGVAAGPVSALIGAELPENLVVAAGGLLLGAAGLAGGWLVRAGRLLGPLREPAARGFRLAGGFDRLLARPVLAVAAAADRADNGLHRGVTMVGRAAIAVAGASRIADEAGIDRTIAALVSGARELGGRARRLQSGLIHRELALATIGGALILAALAAGAVLGLAGAGG